MNIYLHDLPFEKACSIFYEQIEKSGWGTPTESECIPVDENATGRTLAETCWAKISSPHYHASAMDGFALAAESVKEASPSKPIRLSYGDSVVYVDTGDPIPDWADAVIPIEDVEPVGINGLPPENPRKPSMICVGHPLPPVPYSPDG